MALSKEDVEILSEQERKASYERGLREGLSQSKSKFSLRVALGGDSVFVLIMFLIIAMAVGAMFLMYRTQANNPITARVCNVFSETGQVQTTPADENCSNPNVAAFPLVKYCEGETFKEGTTVSLCLDEERLCVYQYQTDCPWGSVGAFR